MAWLIPLSILLPIAAAIIVLIVILWIVFFKYKKISGKLSFKKARFALYKKHLTHLQQLQEYSEEDFKRFNKVVRAFFQEYHNLPQSLTYLELASEFRKQKKPEYSKFCRLMSDISYTGKSKTTEVKNLVEMFAKIVENY